MVAPLAMEVIAGVTWMLLRTLPTGSTVINAVSLKPPEVTVMVEVPAAIAVDSPFL